MKFDGYRIAAHVEEGEARLVSRNGKDWTAQFPAVAADAARCPVTSAILDGEVAVVLPDGTTSFQALQNAMSTPGGREGELVYFVFDLLHLDGYDLTGATLEERKRALAAVLNGGARRGRHPLQRSRGRRTATRSSPAPAGSAWRGSSASARTRATRAGAASRG